MQSALQAAVSRLPMASEGGLLKNEAPGPVERGWLFAPPMVGAARMESDERLGSDETELSLTFPLKSPAQHRFDDDLLRVEPALEAAAADYREWYVSGTLRELRAIAELAAEERESAQRSVLLLNELETQIASRVAARSAERFELLAVQQARLDAQEQLAYLEARFDAALARFRQLTGLQAFPTRDLRRDEALPTAPDYAGHPELRLLALNYEREVASLKSTAPATEPWNLELVGKDISSPGFSERQLGVSIEVPIGDGTALTSTRSSLRALHRNYLMQRDSVLAALQGQWLEETGRRQALLDRQRTAAQRPGPDELSALLAMTRDSRELPIEIKVARLRALLQASAESALTAVRLAASEDRLRQLSGHSL